MKRCTWSRTPIVTAWRRRTSESCPIRRPRNLRDNQLVVLFVRKLVPSFSYDLDSRVLQKFAATRDAHRSTMLCRSRPADAIKKKGASKLWGVPRHWSSHASAVTAKASTRESSNASEPAQPNATTPIAVAPATGPFPRRSRSPEARRKLQAEPAVGRETHHAHSPLYTALENSA